MAALIIAVTVTSIGAIRDELEKERMSSDVLQELGMGVPVSLIVEPILTRKMMGPPGVGLTITGIYGRNVAGKGKPSMERNV